MIKKILTAPHPKLSNISKNVNSIGKKELILLKNLKDTLNAQKNPEGVGLAAPQIGENIAVFVLKNGNRFEFVINPKITNYSKKTNFQALPEKEWLEEGCLSVPGVYSFVERPWEVTVAYNNEKFERVEKKIKGQEAQIFQHEYDHLQGILFTQRVLEQTYA